MTHLQEQRERREAREIQRRLLPADRTPAPGVEIALNWRPAHEVGGDYFDVLRFSDGSLGLCIADVEGKGLPAALVMSSLQAAVRALASPQTAPAALCGRLNAIFCEDLPAARSISLFYAHLEPKTRRLTYANAGHLPPVVRRRKGAPERLTVGGIVLGHLPHRPYAEAQVVLDPGDALVLFTDGVTEAMNGAEEEFGEARIAACACAAPEAGPAELQRRILSEVAAHCDSRFGDDATLAVLEVA
ncbi:MAG TPA: PP2C family protein-serine/threonine phosphatase [Candidatus Polarisedimenticolaceae bacterium]|nr:PP2C family protein-serine/threonine phosphatase [Candidatus Polarisedimenticolaceae bacterium]